MLRVNDLISCLGSTSTGTNCGSNVYSVSNSIYDVSSGQIILMDTRLGELTFRLPINPMVGDRILFIDIGNYLKVNPTRILRNGKKIAKKSEDMFFDVNRVHITMTYMGADADQDGWGVVVDRGI